MKQAEIQSAVETLPTFEEFANYQSHYSKTYELASAEKMANTAAALRLQADVIDAKTALYTAKSALLIDICRSTDMSTPYKIGALTAFNTTVQNPSKPHPRNRLLKALDMSKKVRWNDELPIEQIISNPPKNPYDRAVQIGDRIIDIKRQLSKSACTPLVLLQVGRNPTGQDPTLFSAFLARPLLDNERAGIQIVEPTVEGDRTIFSLPKLGVDPAVLDDKGKKLIAQRNQSYPTKHIDDPILAQLTVGYVAGNAKVLFGKSAIKRAKYEVDVVEPAVRAKRARDCEADYRLRTMRIR